MKRKGLFIVFVAIMMFVAVCLTACNRQIIDVNYKFTKAHICIDNEWIDVDVDKWRDYEGEQIQLTLKDSTVMIIHSRDCILYNGTLPKGE